MRKLTIKNLIDFQREPKERKKSYIRGLNLNDVAKKSKGGGDYWTICVSAITKSFKEDDIRYISDKIDEFECKYAITHREQTKDMYKRNLDILRRFEMFNFDKLRPSESIRFLPQPDDLKIISINGLPVLADPDILFTWENNGTKEIGAIWFAVRITGINSTDLAMCAEIAHHYMDMHHKEKYTINPEYCMAVGLADSKIVTYKQLQNGEVSRMLDLTIEEIKGFINQAP